RYHVSNMILAGIMPGPKEQNGDQVQCFIHPFVNELLHLWKDEFIIKTTRYLNG
ncbi:hypothetical protein K488DRAFT_59807, partial [Vararia minispora EC-137]